MHTFDDLLALVPTAPSYRSSWSHLTEVWPALAALSDCPQDPIHHAEGDVATHTRMVLEAQLTDPTWRELDANRRAILFWAAVFHDVGKPRCTTFEDDGRIASKGHSRTGAAMTRAFLAECGAPFAWREAVCALIAHHQLPFWLIERPEPLRLAIAVSMRLRGEDLCLHAKADALGRICEDQDSLLDNVALAGLTFEEAGCLSAPYAFANDESRVRYFERADRNPGFAAHADYRCCVTVMSGLPGAGKDTWLRQHAAGLPVVSLDTLRAEMGVKPTDNQGRVIQAGFEAARTHLRAGRDFAWNATNVTRQNRGRILQLLLDYGAHVRWVYVEPALEQIRLQNRDRVDAVPEAVINTLLAKLEPPDATEGHDVVYVVPN